MVQDENICPLQIPSKLYSRHKDCDIDTAGGRADGTEVYLAHNKRSKQTFEFCQRFDAENPLMIQYHKEVFVECEHDPSHLQLLVFRADSRLTRPGYCYIQKFDGGQDLWYKGYPITSDSHFENRAFHGYMCSFWPSCAKPWLTRSANWPWGDLKAKIKAKGCMVIYRSHPLSNFPEKEWQYLFCDAEKMLFRHGLSTHQKYVYKVFKIAVDYQTKHLEVKLHTVHIKALFFYACEEIKEAMFEESSGGCFLHLVGSLLECLRKRNIPNYFVEDNNMIDHFDRGAIQKLADAIEALRIFPLQCLTFLASEKGYQRSWLVDVVLRDVECFKKDCDVHRTICRVFVPVLIRQAKKLAFNEECHRSYEKVEEARLQLILAPQDKYGKHVGVPNLDDLLRETFASSDRYTKTLMAQTITERTEMKVFSAEETGSIMKVRDLVGDKDIGDFAGIPIPDDVIGFPLEEAQFLNRLGVTQHNHHANYDYAAYLYESSIDHLENALQKETMDVTFVEDKDILRQVGMQRNRLFVGYTSFLSWVYRNLEIAYSNMHMLPKICHRMQQLENHCKINPGYLDLTDFTADLWKRLGEPDRGAQLQKFVSGLSKVEVDK